MRLVVLDKLFYCSILLLLFMCACNSEKKQGGKAIQIGDSSLIVTETDTNFTKNFTADISINQGGEKDIAKMMVQVDSLKTTQLLKSSNLSNTNVNGFTVNFKECKISFDGIGAKELTPQEPEKNRSVSYVVSEGSLDAIKLKVTGLKDIEIKQRIYTKLKVQKQDESYILSSLGKKISEWYNLAGKEDLFISISNNSFQFDDLNNQKIKLALDKTLRSKSKNEADIQRWMKEVKNVKNYTDPPCKIYVSTAQFKLQGVTKDGQKVNKLIQLDIIE